MMVSRSPRPALRPFLKAVWADERAFRGGAERELVLPTGAMHVVFRLDHPLHLFDGLEDRCGRTLDHAIVGGARAAFYVRDVSKPMRSVGAQLRPGAAEVLLGVPASEPVPFQPGIPGIRRAATGRVPQDLTGMDAPRPHRGDGLGRSILFKTGRRPGGDRKSVV